MAPPPLAVRRFLLRPAMFAIGVVLAIVLLPLWLIGSALVSLPVGFVARPLRLLCFAYLYLLVEVAGLVAAFGQWITLGFGRRLRTDRGQERTFALLRNCLTILLTAAEHYLRLEVESHPSDRPEPEVPLIVVSRHAGPGDSLLLVHRLLVDFHRRPHVVLKAALQWDPLLDVILHRSPNVFITRGEPTEKVVERISLLAERMGPADALLIFPEGGNFTEHRRHQVITKLRSNGHILAAQRAEDLERLLAPRITGLHAALVARTDAAVCIVAHTGLDEIDTLVKVWEAIPVRNTLVVSWEYFEASEVPRNPVALHDWVGYHWQLMDTWVALQSAELLARQAEADAA